MNKQSTDEEQSISKEVIHFQQTLLYYYRTLGYISVTGSRGQYYIDQSYKEMSNAYNQCTLDERKRIKLPIKQRSTDDDDETGGLSTELAKVAMCYNISHSRECCIQ